MSRPVNQHLTNEEFVSYVLGDIPPSVGSDIDAHLERCRACVVSLHEYFEADQSFPSQEFEAQREQFSTMLRQDLGIEPALAGLTALRALISSLAPFHPWSPPLLLAAKTSIDAVVASVDGRYGYSIEEDENRDIHICVTAVDPELQSFEVVARAGGWTASTTMVIEQSIVRAQVTVPFADRTNTIAPTDMLQLDIRPRAGSKE